MSALRDWMQANIGGLREDRSTEDYALEFLKNDHAIVLRDAHIVPAQIGTIDRLNAELATAKARIEYLESYALEAQQHSVTQANELRRVKCGVSQWTDEMIRNHFGQSKTKQEIEKIVGRKIDWQEQAL